MFSKFHVERSTFSKLIRPLYDTSCNAGDSILIIDTTTNTVYEKDGTN